MQNSQEMKENVSICIIDDDSAQRKSLAAVLGTEELLTVGFETGEEALAACTQQDFHVVILDLKLPDMDGILVMTQIQRLNPHAKIIIHTGFATVDSAMTAVNHGAFAFMRKMGDPEELINHVQRALLVLYTESLEAVVISRNKELQKEIEDRRIAEEQTLAALREKEVLLKEVHHRVKNNLQVISSLLRLQSSYSQDGKTSDMFKKSQERVSAMARIHEKLCQNKDLGQIDFTRYVHELTEELVLSYGGSDKVQLTIEMRDIFLSLNTAVPCGLIINELVSNALKYAFPEKENCELLVRFHSSDGNHALTVKDNGIGLPSEIDFQNLTSLGLELVSAFVLQLNGKLSVDNVAGACFAIIFPYDI